MKKPFLFALAVIAAALLLMGATITGYTDWQKRAAPGNPAAANLRMFADSATSKFKCLDSAGAACYFDTAIIAAGSAIWSGASSPNGSDVAPHNMTSDTAPSPYVASAITTSPCGGGVGEAFGPAWNAFDGSATTFWAGDNFCGSWTLRIDLGTATSVGLASYQISQRTSPAGVPGAWTFQGSTNASTWTTLDTESGISWSLPTTNRSFPVNASTPFRYFQLVATTAVQSCCRPEIAELNLIAVAFTGGATGDFYFLPATKAWYGPRPAGGSPSWPLAGTLN